MNNAERLTRLKRELESMSLRHARETGSPGMVRSPERLGAESKRARILARRIAELTRALGEDKER